MKNRFFALQGLLILFVLSMSLTGYAQLGQNGVAYVLLSKEFDQHGVYRLNNYDPGATWRVDPYKLFNLNTMTGKASGLSANQQKQIFLLSSTGAGDWADAPVGWLPSNMKFADDSAIYLKVMLPNDPEGGVTGYRRSSTPHWSSATSSGSYWKINHTISGVTYPYSVVFGGPTEVKFLNTVSGTTGTPIWPGTFGPTTGLAHPDPAENRKVILPSHWAGVAYYAYGTTNHPEFPGEALDGTIGRNGNLKPMKIWSEGKSGHEVSPKHIFACIVKRVYEHRTKSLDLYSADDLAAPPPTIAPTEQSSGMLSSIDVRAKEFYGKYCGDNCIPGGSIGSNTIETQLSTVVVVTSTKGARYGFNPQGIRKNYTAATAINAALRVVRPSSSVTEPIAISTDDLGTTFAPVIVNRTYLAGIGINPMTLKTIGVSSDFSNPTGLDYIYGSNADKFVVQDSWWGKGGIAYEYFEDTKTVRKLDYMAMTGDIPSVQELGLLAGDVDDIGVDGEGYLYVLRTEKSPSDIEMAAMDVNHLNPSASPHYFSISSTWLRPPPEEGSTSDPTPIPSGSQQPGDYKVVTLKQQVTKALTRYPQGTGSLGAAEPRGSVGAGFDFWTRSIHIAPSGAIAWKHVTFSAEEDADRNSFYPGELAVVNLAKVPDVKPGSSQLNVIVIPNAAPGDGESPDTSYPGTSISEHSTLVFKVEGYKPYINGIYHDLKSIGDIVNPNTGVVKHTNVKLNAIPNADGDYWHDENFDGSPSGFPSSMFESSTKKTEFKWTIDWVENNSVPAAPADIKLIENMATDLPGTGDYGALAYQFPHPGNYLVKAEVTYHKFNMTGIDASVRPHELTDVPITIHTEPFIVKVYSSSLDINKGPSYITNIQMLPSSRTAFGVPGSSDAGTGTVMSLIDFQEDNPLGGITITFDAQFVRDANRTSTVLSDLATYDGVGVWDYRYYAQLMAEMNTYFPALSYVQPSIITNPGSTAVADHVYNYEPAGAVDNISSKIKTNVYNPGRPKGAEVGADNGTRVDQEPIDKDWSFIQWGLYLQPTGPYALATPTAALGTGNNRHSRGILVARGSCDETGVTIAPNGNRKYSVTIPVGPDKISQLIHTPKDPETFSLHLEIIYPRVTWLSNDLGEGTGEKRFSSMVPLSRTDDGVMQHPFHLLGRMRLANGTDAEPTTNFLINQGWKDGSDDFFVGGDESIGVLARDYTLPELTESPGANPTPVIQTTGDDVTNVEVVFAVYDNNPHHEPGTFYPAYQTVRNMAARFDASDANKEFKQGPAITSINPMPGGNEVLFFTNNSWKCGASFTTLLAEYGPTGPFQRESDLQNWIGSLDYTVMGSVRDGIGSYSTIMEHHFFHQQAYDDLGLSSTIPVENRINIDGTLIKAIERIDNDPPDIEVELVSQVDNRRWVFKLIENINDDGPVPTTLAQLGNCTLEAASFNLQNDAEVASHTINTVPGCTAYPLAVGNTDVNVTTYLPAAVPQFRRASRLLVNININDNTGWRDLALAQVAITNNDGGVVSILPANSPAIRLVPSLTLNGDTVPEFVNRPRASYAIDMPMKALAGVNQVTIEVRARDQNGNERALIIPVGVVESSFDTRVLEIKENRN